MSESAMRLALALAVACTVAITVAAWACDAGPEPKQQCKRPVLEHCAQ